MDGYTFAPHALSELLALHEGHLFAYISWTASERPEVESFPIPATLAAANIRVGYSCAIVLNSNTCSDGSMVGNLARARSSFGGQMSTN